jgi:kumamolisin
MPSTHNRVALPGSERKTIKGAKVKRAADPKERIQISLRVRSRTRGRPPAADLMAMGSQLPAERKYLTREEFAEQYGADPRDIASVENFAHTHDLTVESVSLEQQTVKLSGTVAAFQAAFGVKLKHFQSRGATYRGRTGAIYIPKELDGIIVGVHGLDNRRVAAPHFRQFKSQKKSGTSPRSGQDQSHAVLDVAKLYNFPSGLTGNGQCIALIELNDTDQSGKPVGAGFRASDITAFFKKYGIPTPKIVSVGVDGGGNLPGHSQADGEVVLDIEVAGAVAPGANIVVYFAPNTTAGFIDAVKAAVHDTVRRPSVISISWGGPEDANGQTSPQFFQGLDEAFQEAAALGVTVCCAAGDNGSADMTQQDWDGKPHADFPSSSPFAIACGGTKLIGSGTSIQSEAVWNEGWTDGAGGGGVSNYFALPTYQASVKVPSSPAGKAGRGLPDVSGNADPITGYQVYLNKAWGVIGGTSAVAPLLAGLVALINERIVSKTGHSVGFINPLLYGSLNAALRDVTQGNNDISGTLHGTYSAGSGWNACSGLGVPDGSKLLVALGG